MLKPDLEVTEFDPMRAGERDFQLLNEFMDRIRQEIWPEDPPPTVEETTLRWRSRPASLSIREWMTSRKDKGEIVATASASY